MLQEKKRFLRERYDRMEIAGWRTTKRTMSVLSMIPTPMVVGLFVHQSRQTYSIRSEGRNLPHLPRLISSRSLRLIGYRNQGTWCNADPRSMPTDCTKSWNYCATRLHLISTLGVYVSRANVQKLNFNLLSKNWTPFLLQNGPGHMQMTQWHIPH